MSKLAIKREESRANANVNETANEAHYPGKMAPNREENTVWLRRRKKRRRICGSKRAARATIIPQKRSDFFSRIVEMWVFTAGEIHFAK